MRDPLAGDFEDSGSIPLVALLIAVLHALPVFAIAYLFRNRALTVIASFAMGAVAIGIGRSSYVFLDVIAVGIGLYCGLNYIKNQKN